MEKEKIILDVDTGSDDAVAIICALLSDEFDVLGICTVSGNVNIDNATDNTLRVVDYLNSSVKVYKGASLPLASTLIPWGIQGLTLPHNEISLDDSKRIHPDHLPLPKPNITYEDKSAVIWLIETLLKQEDHSVTLVPVGPLTNIALAIRSDERILKKIKRIVLMGGSHDVYAPTQGAEFNIWVDPEAAEIVINSGLDVTMVSLDATSCICLDYNEAKRIRDINTRAAIFVADMIEQRLNAAKKTMNKQAGQVVGIALHDPLAVCAIKHPEVLTDIWDTSCHIDLGRSYAYGETVLGRNYQSEINEKGEYVNLPNNIHYARKANKEIFFNWLYNLLVEDTK